MSSTQEKPFSPSARVQLREHFEGHDPESHGSRWEDIWTKSFTPWDQGMPHPGLMDLLQSRSHLPALETSKRRPRALVPGCGRGYDVFLLASYGYDAYGIDLATTAVKIAKENSKTFAEREEYKVKDEKVGRGKAEIVEGDFFKDDWWENITADKQGFDLVYDYTFFCALPTSMRPKWAARHAQLLGPQGRLICLEFPTYKEPSSGGPPWAVRPVEYMAYLSKPGETVSYGQDGLVEGVEEDKPERSRNGLVRTGHWQPERTPEIGKGTDWISVWQHQ